MTEKSSRTIMDDLWTALQGGLHTILQEIMTSDTHVVSHHLLTVIRGAVGGVASGGDGIIFVGVDEELQQVPYDLR